MQPGGGLPIYAAGIVAYAQWYLSRGDTVDDVTARIEGEYRFGATDPQVVRLSVEQAVLNVAATQRAEAANQSETLASQFLRFEPTNEMVGVRVIMTLQFPDGHAETISVVVNAREGRTIAEALDAAVSFVDRGGLTGRTGRHYVGTVLASTVGQLIDGGAANPAVTL